MPNLREQIEQELQALSHELTQFQTNGQYLNQSRALVSNAITSLEQVNQLFQGLALEFREALLGNIEDWKDSAVEFESKVNASVSQFSIIIEDLNHVRDRTLLPEKILEELSSHAQTLNKLDETLADLLQKQADESLLHAQKNSNIQELIKNLERTNTERHDLSDKKAVAQFSQFAQTVQQLFSDSQNNLKSIEDSLAQQYKKTTDDIDRLKDKLQIQQEKGEIIIALLKNQEEKDRSSQNTVLIIGAIILLLGLVNLVLLFINT